MDDGNWCRDQTTLEAYAISFFKDLYGPLNFPSTTTLDRGGFPRITQDQRANLLLPFKDGEIHSAITSMGAYKAPGADRFQPVFYKQLWSTVGPALINLVKDFFTLGVLPAGSNETLITLSAEVDCPERIQQFRPISLYNVFYNYHKGHGL